MRTESYSEARRASSALRNVAYVAAMGTEIERKFLVDPTWQPRDAGTLYKQGYLNSAKERVVRVRIAGAEAKLTIKGPSVGITRPEFEYAITLADAQTMLDELCEQPLVEKTRHLEQHAGHSFEVDVFAGANQGLVIAELELASADELFEKPSWLGADVSHDARYFNSNLMRKPFSTW